MKTSAMVDFDIEGRVAVVTGGTGVLGGTMARSLADAGARVVVIGRNESRAREITDAIVQRGGHAIWVAADVRLKSELERALAKTVREYRSVDILINAAGGNIPGATVEEGQTVFEISTDAIEDVIRLNLMGTILPTLVFGRGMADQKRGSVINISSMTATRGITRVVGYSAAKAAVENFTRWMSVELAQKFGDGVRVNAIAPGFLLAEQNRSLLVSDSGAPTERGRSILAQTPMARFGRPEELLGAVHWLCSDASSFVTGAVIPVDGGFGAFGGV